MQQLGRVLKDRAHGRLLSAAVRIFHGSVEAPRVPGEGLSPIRCPHVTTCAASSCLSHLPLSCSTALSGMLCAAVAWFFWRYFFGGCLPCFSVPGSAPPPPLPRWEAGGGSPRSRRLMLAELG